MNKITGKPLSALQDHQQHYGLRKLSFGLASVLLGSTWLMMQNGPVAHADAVNVSSEPANVSNQASAQQPYQADNTNEQNNVVQSATAQPAYTAVPKATQNNKVISGANQTTGAYVQVPSQASNEAGQISADSSAVNMSSAANGAAINATSDAHSASLVNKFNTAAYQNYSFGGNSSYSFPWDNPGIGTETSPSSGSGDGSVTKPPAPKYGSVSFDIYDDTTRTIVGSVFRWGREGDFASVSPSDVAEAIGHSTATFTGGFGFDVIGDGPSFDTIHIKHVIKHINRQVTYDWTVTAQSDWGSTSIGMTAKKHKTLVGHLVGKKDLFTNKVKYDKSVSDLNVSSLNQSITTPMGTYICSYNSDGDVHVNPFATGTTSSSVVGRVYLSPDYLTEAKLAQVTSNFADDSAPINLTFNTNVTYSRMIVPIEIKYHFINPVTKKTQYLPSDYVIGKFGDNVDIEYKDIPSFKIVNENALIKQVNLSRLIARTNKAGRLVFNTPKIDVALQVVPQVNYRYYDLQNDANKAATMSALMPHWSSQSQNGSASDKWDQSVEGKKNIKDILDSLTYIDNIGVDGKANGDKRTEQLKQILLDGYDIRGADGKAWADIGRARSAMALAQASQVYTINGIVWSNAKFKKELRKATDKNLLDTINKVVQQYKKSVQGNINQMNAAMENLNQLIQADKSRTHNNYKSTGNDVNAANIDEEMIGTAGDKLSTIKVADSMKSTLKPVRVTQGLVHLYDLFSMKDPNNNAKDKPRMATPGTVLLSGKVISQLPLIAANGDFDPNEIYNPDSYGNYHKETLIINMKKNANGDYWPPEMSNGPITGFEEKDGNTSSYLSTTGENHLGDSGYVPIYTVWTPQFEKLITLGHGAEYVVDDVTGDVTKVKYGLQNDGTVWENNPVYYFKIYEGYDLYINGRKVDDSNTGNKGYYMFNSDEYLKAMQNNQATFEFEYRPETANINVKIVDQNGNVLDNSTVKGNVDSVVFMNGMSYGTQFINSYNQNHKDSYMEYVDTDTPYNLAIQPKDHDKTFSYVYHVKVYNLVWKNTLDTDISERTVYFNNINDPKNSHAAITQTVGFKFQQEYYDDGHGDSFDTGVIKFLPQGSFSDLNVQITNILGTSDWHSTAGEQYLSGYEPTYPGGVSVTIDYNGPSPVVPDPGDPTPGDNPDDPGLSDNNKHPSGPTTPTSPGDDDFPDDPSDNN